MAKKMSASAPPQPKDMRSKPNPSLRPGTGTVNMAKAMKVNSKKGKK